MGPLPSTTESVLLSTVWCAIHFGGRAITEKSANWLPLYVYPANITSSLMRIVNTYIGASSVPLTLAVWKASSTARSQASRPGFESFCVARSPRAFHAAASEAFPDPESSAATRSEAIISHVYHLALTHPGANFPAATPVASAPGVGAFPTALTRPRRPSTLAPFMRGLFSSVVLLVLLSCAASRPAEVAAPRLAAPPEEEVTHAWDAEAAPLDGATPGKPKVQAPPPLADFREAFLAALQEGNGQGPGAEAATQQAVTLAAGLTGEERFMAHRLASRRAEATGDGQRAEATARAFLRACGPEQQGPCRDAALHALKVASHLKGASRGLVADEAKWRALDTCSAQAEVRRAPAACLDEAERFGKAHGDPVLSSRAALVRALAEKVPARQKLLLAQVPRACTERACQPQAQAAWLALARVLAAAGSPEDALGPLLEAQKSATAVAPAARRPWSRLEELDALCAKVDAAKGAGTCRKAERERLGQLVYRDFSKDQAGEGLPPAQVKSVNEHYAPLMQECLAEQARRLTPPDIARYEVRWVVFNDGRVGEAHLRRDQDGTELAACVRRQFETWRYPRYEGEFQNVEQAYTVSAVERRR